MSYLAQMLAGYRQGLSDEPLQPVEHLETALAEASDPTQRSALLGGPHQDAYPPESPQHEHR